jgi:hypothetical protein
VHRTAARPPKSPPFTQSSSAHVAHAIVVTTPRCATEGGASPMQHATRRRCKMRRANRMTRYSKQLDSTDPLGGLLVCMPCYIDLALIISLPTHGMMRSQRRVRRAVTSRTLSCAAPRVLIYLIPNKLATNYIELATNYIARSKRHLATIYVLRGFPNGVCFHPIIAET